MNVLSLFDGCSGGQQALERAGIKYNKYYASEIDKFAIQVTQHNYPNTIQIGSVVDVDVTKLEPIDLLIGGSPCTNFSFAGKRNGMTTSCNEEIYTLERYLELKAEGFEFEGESYLFWEYMRILTDIRKYNPDVLFLLENVEMGAKWERVLSEAIGIYGVHINSALVSAQNRKRIYWTNIRVKKVGLFGELHSDIPQPEDRGILLKDILEDEVDEKYYIANKSMMSFITDEWRLNKKYTQINGEKGLPQMARQYSNWNGDYVCISSTQKNATVTTNKSSPMTAAMGMGGGHVPMIAIHIPEATSKGYVEIEPGECFDAENINSKTRRGRKMTDKSNNLMATTTNFMRYEGIKSGTWRTHNDGKGFREIESGKAACVPARAREDGSGQNVAQIGARIRRLTPVECERLQTMKDNYTAVVSDSQRYKMIGNGWTIDVIAHIFKFIIQ